MASFHFSAQVLKCSQGHSAVAAAAYRSRCQLRDERTGEMQDYRRKDGLHHSEILLPEGAAPFLGDRERLWNHVEAIEARKDAQLAREINMALPHELTDAQRLQLVRDFARDQFVSRGMVVDLAIHHPVPDGKSDQRNIHAHLMLSLRRATPDGFDRVKTRAWNSDAMLVEWRAAWSAAQNEALGRGGHVVRVDHRTLEVQVQAARSAGDLTRATLLDRTPEVHVGPRAAAAAYRGRTPPSRQRMAQTRQQPRKSAQGSPPKAKRVIRYPEIDRGSRQEWNRQVVAANRVRLSGFADHRERQLMQFRRHEARALRRVAQLDRQLAVLADSSQKSLEPMMLLKARRARALGRAKLARLLIVDLECILAQTLGMQRHHDQRYRVFSRTWRDNARDPRCRGRRRLLLE